MTELMASDMMDEGWLRWVEGGMLVRRWLEEFVLEQMGELV